jgi:hypothetical protein
MRIVILSTIVMLFAFVASAANTLASDFGSEHPSEYDLLTPAPHQFDIEADDTYQFVTGDSILRRRVNSFPDSAIRLKHDLGTSQMQNPEVLATYWFDSVNAAQFQFRYIAPYGSHGGNPAFNFGGTVISAGQILNNGGTRWYTFGGYYERRLTPLYQDRESGLPGFLQGWDLRAKIGFEFTYNDFRINDGKPVFSQRSPFEARIRFHEKGLPIPVVGMEARRWLMPNLALEATAQGYWANKWNSGRTEGGTVYDSQSGFETHWRAIYWNPRWHGVSPFVGISYWYSKYTQTSSGVGNLLRVQMFGPELGFNWSI